MTVATLEMRDISKQFGGRPANESVSFSVMPGEIHALIGENGAGKTTLMNIASGLYKQDIGHVLMEGRACDWTDPLEALEGGVAMVHQTFMLVDTFTVAENVSLGKRRGFGAQSRERLDAEVVEVAERFGIPMRRASDTGTEWTRRRARDLSPSEKQRVAILSALYRHSKLLILDEPTSVLAPEETEAFFDVLRRLKAEGLAMVFISHKVREVLDLCDRVTVLRGGRVVAAAEVRELDDERLATLMVGREMHPTVRTTSTARPQEVLRVTDLWAQGDRGSHALKGVSLTLRAGEILGVAGVDGSGQHELVECLAGLRSWERGEVSFGGQGSADVRGSAGDHGSDDVRGSAGGHGSADVRGSAGGQRTASGEGSASAGRKNAKQRVSHVPANPRREGLILDGDASWNVGLRHLDEPEARGAGGVVLKRRYFGQLAERLIEEYDVRNCRPNTRVADLSGGNMQKLLLGRELTLPREVALIVNPTTGLDVGAIEAIRARILRSAEAGTAVILVSNELDELFALSDRIAVFFNGGIAGELDRDQADRNSVGRLMSGLV